MSQSKCCPSIGVYIYIYIECQFAKVAPWNRRHVHTTHTQRRITTHIIFPTRHKDSGLSIGTNSECNWLLGVVTTSREYILIIEYYSRYSNSTSIYISSILQIPVPLVYSFLTNKYLNPHIVYISMYIYSYTQQYPSQFACHDP